MDTLKLVVLGAGYSARAAIKALSTSTPLDVVATTRSPEKAEALEREGIKSLIFDGQTPSPSLEAALGAASHILASAAPDAEGDPVLRTFGPTLVAAQNLRWIGYYSTVGVYGDADGAWIDESAQPKPLSARNRYRVAAEAAWSACAQSHAVPLSILRLAGIYGPGRSPFDKLRAGRARRIDKPGQVFNRIHRDDIGAITARAAQVRLEGIFNICDDEPAPPQDVIGHAAALMGVAPPPLVAFEDADLSAMARSFYAGNRRVSNAAIKRALDYQFLYPTYREGHAAILAAEAETND